MFSRVIWIVLDSVGIGEMPDAAAYGDSGSDTLGNIGPGAKAAVPDLGKHLLTANEQVVFVLRSVAAALGNIGPDAASALPALEQALKMHRVVYTAQEAIQKIKGEPVATWY